MSDALNFSQALAYEEQMIPMRLVVDTNIAVSAALNPAGPQLTALLLALTRPARLYISNAVLTEYRVVLQRPEFHIRSDK